MGSNERKYCRDGLGTKKWSVVSNIVGGFLLVLLFNEKIDTFGIFGRFYQISSGREGSIFEAMGTPPCACMTNTYTPQGRGLLYVPWVGVT